MTWVVRMHSTVIVMVVHYFHVVAPVDGLENPYWASTDQASTFEAIEAIEDAIASILLFEDQHQQHGWSFELVRTAVVMLDEANVRFIDALKD